MNFKNYLFCMIFVASCSFAAQKEPVEKSRIPHPKPVITSKLIKQLLPETLGLKFLFVSEEDSFAGGTVYQLGGDQPPRKISLADLKARLNGKA